MKITDIQTVVVNAQRERTWLFVEVHTDEGVVGIGEASQNRLDAGAVAQIRELAPLYIGRSPLDVIGERSLLLRRPDAHRMLFSAVSGIEQALWDLCGKALGVPCYQLLGGAVRDRIRLYANIVLAAINRSPEEYAELAKRAALEGFTAVKLNPIDPVLPRSRLPGSDEFKRLADLAVERVRAVREAVGPTVDVLTDWSYAVPPSEARRLAERMAEFHLFWIEEPFWSADPSLLAEFRRGLGTRLAGGEMSSGLVPFRRLLEAKAVDVLMVDVKWIGGILEARKVSAMAEAYETEIGPHNMSGPVATAASVQLCATLPNFLILEYCWGAVPWRADLVEGTERVEKGFIPLPTTPGLGISWNSQAAREYRYQP
ncbi:MAG: mandelate racemase/muconate lactonizing enzyme family protein [Chloroflexota bacterium]|nr:mandelate racemase/muconate lactonizing enzyme family protein [Chloroflexota bacterium]